MSNRRDLSNAKPIVHGLLRLTEPLIGPLMRLRQSRKDPSEIPVSIVIPVHPKDIAWARRCISYARKNVLHPIEEVLVVSRPDHGMDDFLKEVGARFVDESSVLPMPLDELKSRLTEHGFSHWNWIFQQLLKLSADGYAKSDHILIIDADTLLLRPRVFKRGNTLHQEFSHERNPNYLSAFSKLFGREEAHRFSFVCHYMFAERRILHAMKEAIKENTGKEWYDAIIDLAAPENWSEEELAQDPFNYFSEYEIYGLFCRSFYDEVNLTYFFNYGAEDYRPDSDDLGVYLKGLPSFYRWASFHSYYYSN